MFFFKLLSLLPTPVLYLFADLLYFLAYKVFKYRKRIVEENLRKAFPEKSTEDIQVLIQKFYHNLTDIVVEILKTLSLSEKELSARIRIVNPELPQKYVLSQQSIIVLTGHLCNWEWLLSACMVKFKYPVDAVYKPLNNSFSNKLMLRIRSRFGAFPITMKETLRTQIKKKNTPHTLAMVADQTPLKNEIQYWTKFMGQETPYYVGADKIARLLNMPVLFVGMTRVRRGYYEIYFKEIETPPFSENEFSITERFNVLLEDAIKSHPENWLWSHRRWKHQKD